MKNALAGVCIGFLLFFGSWGLLFWNEGRAVKRQQDLDEGRDLVVQVGLTQANGTIDKSLDSKLIYVNGVVSGGSSNIFDDEFDLNVTKLTNALKYRRDVEMFQWQERTETKTEKTSAGGTKKTTSYYYDQVWSSSLISSSSFRESANHVNPTSFLISPYSATASPITLGAYKMADVLLGEVNWWTTWNDVPLNSSSYSVSGYTSTFGSGQFQLSKASSTASIGDTRVTFETVLPDDVSVVAMQTSDGSLKPYITEGDRELWLFSRGTVSSDELFNEAEDDNTTLTWILRFVGFLCMVFGICLVLNPIATAFDVLPFCGDALEGCIGGCIIPCIAVVISIPFTLLIISIAWIFYRPYFAAVTVVMLAILGLIYFYYLKPKLQEQNTSPEGKQTEEQYEPSATAVPMGDQQAPNQSPQYGGNEPAPFSMALDNEAPPQNQGYGDGGNTEPGVYKPPA
eukprot:scaffold11675_cov123-Cylindrotheca_fusiformis.AAC.4